MAFVGSEHGPRRSEMAAELGAESLGVDSRGLERMIAACRGEEEQGRVTPVLQDPGGNQFVEWEIAAGRKRRVYLKHLGYELSGPDLQVQEVREEGERFADALLTCASQGVAGYLEEARSAGKIDPQQFASASKAVPANLEAWVRDPLIHALSPNLRGGIARAIEAEDWEALVNAFRKRMSFGTGGIRGLMAFDRASIERLQQDGIDAPILKGPNTFNNIVVLLTSAGVAAYGRKCGFRSIVIGYDSRVRGADFARLIATLFLSYGYLVYLFDAPCPYPEVTFAIPHLRADLGILISASHNDYRYNGYKLSCSNGSQFDPAERDELYNRFIVPATSASIRLTPLARAPREQLVYLGGDRPLPGVDYHGASIQDLHGAHRRHVESFLVHRGRPDAASAVGIGFCAFHGAGRVAVPALLRDAGFTNVRVVEENGLNDLNGLFPSFRSDPGREQQPDPGDPRAARVAADAFRRQYGEERWRETDVLVGTDPDADRCGVVVKIPQEERADFGGEDSTLLSADEMWALLLWYRLTQDARVVPAESFVALSHTTTDTITRLALRFGAGVVKTWVGFGSLAAGVRDVWEGRLAQGLHEGKRSPDDPLCHPYLYESYGMEGERRRFNLAALEQSNGFSILGGPPPDARSLGTGGHVRDKDGTFAALLVAEVAQWAKDRGTTIYELLDREIHCDREIGLFVTYYEPDPLDGEYPGIEGDLLKKEALSRVLALGEESRRRGLRLGAQEVKSCVLYRTGKYDHLYPPGQGFAFPDEGVRFYFDAERRQHATVRPSGTTNSLRFHVQLFSRPERDEVRAQRRALRAEARAIVTRLREVMGVPRAEA